MSDDHEAEMDIEVVEEERPAGRRLKSTVQATGNRETRGRGTRNPVEDDNRFGGHFDRLPSHDSDREGAQKSVEGWVLFVTGVHEEAATDDVQDAFADYGVVKNTWLNLDRQTGFVKGYVLVEYASKAEAEDAISGLNDTELLGQKIQVGWAFVKTPAGNGRRR